MWCSLFLTIVDDISHAIWLYLMKEKSETRYYLKLFIFMAKTQFDKNVKMVRIDNDLKLGLIKSFYAGK